MGRKPDLANREKGFQLYCKLNRNKSAVGRALGIPVQTIGIWSREEKWDEKLAAIQTRLRSEYEKVQKAKENEIVDDKLKKLNLLEELEAKVANALSATNGHEVKINSWKDLMAAVEFITKERKQELGNGTGNEPYIETTAKNEKQLDDEIRSLSELVNRAIPIPALPDGNTDQ